MSISPGILADGYASSLSQAPLTTSYTPVTNGIDDYIFAPLTSPNITTTGIFDGWHSQTQNVPFSYASIVAASPSNYAYDIYELVYRTKADGLYLSKLVYVYQEPNVKTDRKLVTDIMTKADELLLDFIEIQQVSYRGTANLKKSIATQEITL
jgi:hypothetical protein